MITYEECIKRIGIPGGMGYEALRNKYLIQIPIILHQKETLEKYNIINILDDEFNLREKE